MSKENIQIIHDKFEDYIFEMNSIEQTSKLLATSCKNKNIRKGDIKYGIRKFHQTMLMEIVNKTDISNKKDKYAKFVKSEIECCEIYI